MICLQETKVIDALFPAGVLADWGYPYQDQALSRMKSYNGVAILSRWPLEDVRPQQSGLVPADQLFKAGLKARRGQRPVRPPIDPDH